MSANLRWALIIVSISSAPSWGFESDANTTDARPSLRPLFSDDFKIDSRSKYQTNGDVKWQSGRLALAAGSSFSRALKAGSWVQFNLGMEFAELTKDGDQSATHLQIKLDVASACVVAWIQTRQDGKTSVCIHIFDTALQDGKLTLVREGVIAADGFSGTWVVAYRYGVIQVFRKSQPIVIGYIDNAAVTGFRLLQKGTANQVSALAASSSDAPRPTVARRPLSKEQQKQIAAATKLHFEALRFFQQGQATKGIVPARQVLAILRRVLGEEHPDYTASLNNVAMFYQEMGEYAKAEPLFLQARDLQRKFLGESHPLYATCLNNLAVLYDLMGEYTKAEPLYRQALDLQKKVLGEQHPKYANSQSNLAGLYHRMGEFARPKKFSFWRGSVAKGQSRKPGSVHQVRKLYAQAARIRRQTKLARNTSAHRGLV